MNIRLATADDAPGINRIYNQAIEDKLTAHTEPMTLQETRIWMESHSPDKYPVWVCEDGNEVLGWLSFSPYRSGRPAVSKTVEFSYYVCRERTGKGVGSALMRRAIEKATDMGFRQALAIILERNAGSIAFTEKQGFTRWGYLPGVADFEGEVCGHCYYGLNLG